ncbi:MAG: tetratricopeptide repeat protein [Thiohalomonadales bacterium]
MRSTNFDILDRLCSFRRLIVLVCLTSMMSLLSFVVSSDAQARHNRFSSTPKSYIPAPADTDNNFNTDNEYGIDKEHAPSSEPVSIDQPEPVEFDAEPDAEFEAVTESDEPVPQAVVVPLIEEVVPITTLNSRKEPASDNSTTLSFEPASNPEPEPEHKEELREDEPASSDSHPAVVKIKPKQIKQTTHSDSVVNVSKADAAKSANNEPLAVTWYREKAELGDVEAQYNLAMIYETGFGIEKDYSAAINWYSKAASQGHAEAQLKLGMLYLLGLGAPESGIKGGKWVRSSARQDNRFARILSEKFLSKNIDGLSVTETLTKVRQIYNTKNPIQAEETLLTLIATAEVKSNHRPTKKRFAGGITGSGAKEGSVGNRVPDFLAEKKIEKIAAKNSLAVVRRNAKEGIAAAQYEWGMILTKGEQVPRDKNQAVKWFQAAADQNYPAGLYKMALAKLYGIGVDMDLEQGRALLAQAAGRGHPVAKLFQKYLGLKDIKQSTEVISSISVAWQLENAIENKSPDAMLALGYMFHNGWGVTYNQVEGENWMNQAKAAGAVEASRQLRIAHVDDLVLQESEGDFSQSLDRKTTALIVENSLVESGVGTSTQPTESSVALPKDDDRKIARTVSETFVKLKVRAEEIFGRDADKQKPMVLIIGGFILGFLVFRIMRRPSNRHSESAYRY